MPPAELDGTAVSIVARRLLSSTRSRLFCRLSRYVYAPPRAARSSAASTSRTADQVARALVSDARRARDVVDGVALKRQQVGHLRRLHAHELLHLRGIVPVVFLGGVEHRDALVHELQHVLVAGDDHHIDTGFRRLPRDGADDVVGLEARVFENRDAHGFEQAADVAAICSARSGGASVRLALYSANSCSRNVGPRSRIPPPCIPARAPR